MKTTFMEETNICKHATANHVMRFRRPER